MTRSIAYDDDFTLEFFPTGNGCFKFRLCIETDNPERFARFRQALDCAETVLRIPHREREAKLREQELLDEMLEWGC